VCDLCVCPRVKTKSAETTTIKLGTGIVHHDISHQWLLGQTVKGQGHRVTKCKKATGYQGQLCRYCFYSGRFLVFRHARATCCTDQGEIWQGVWDLSPPPCQILLWSVQGCGFTTPKLENHEFYQNNCPSGVGLAPFLQNLLVFAHSYKLHNFAIYLVALAP